MIVKHQISVIAISCLCLLVVVSPAQETGQWAVTVYSNYTQPVGSLNDWFKSSFNFGLGAGQQIRDDWFIEGLLEYTEFSEENLVGYAKDHVQLNLEHVGLLLNGKYKLKKTFDIQIYFNLGGGLFYWKGIRGEIEANPALDPSLPFIERRVLEEWNWGFRSGLGMEYFLLPHLSLDVVGYYRLIIGDLWPTLQPHIELESVSGFQTINVSMNLKYYF